jgi:hypothetical protein
MDARVTISQERGLSRVAFEAWLADWALESKQVLTHKGNDYADTDDVLANFRRMFQICKLWDIRPAERPGDVYWFYILIKMDRMRNLRDKEPDNETVEDSIGDCINYMLLYRAFLKEQRHENAG